MQNKALKYGTMACDTMMRKFDAIDLPPKGGFHYHQGVFLSGMMNVYSVCGDERYFDYIKRWVDSIVKGPRIIDQYCVGALDDYMAGILLFDLFERTGDEKYSETLHMLVCNIRNWSRNSYGGFWHKIWLLDQMWLDGLYMSGPIQAMYSKKFGDDCYIKEAAKQAIIMYENIQDKETKLLYHAWDPSKTAPWADKETGLAPEFWGRALGWYVVSVLDIMEQMDNDSEDYKKLAQIEREVLGAVYTYQSSKNNLWYQVVNKENCPGNWTESSCSMLFVYAGAKAVRMGVIEESYLEKALKGFEAIIDTFTEIKGEDLLISGVCIGTGVLSYEGYIARPTSTNDLHGMGAFLLMCSEIARIK